MDGRRRCCTKEVQAQHENAAPDQNQSSHITLKWLPIGKASQKYFAGVEQRYFQRDPTQLVS